MLRKILSFILTGLILLSLVSCNKSKSGLPKDFAFSITWGTLGASSYDSKTGELIKTSHSVNTDKYTAHVIMTDAQLKSVYDSLFSDIDITQYPDTYYPCNDPDSEMRMRSSPSETIIISVTANGRTKTVECHDLVSMSPEYGYCDEAKAFLTSINNIVSLITGLPEWEAIPEPDFGFCRFIPSNYCVA